MTSSATPGLAGAHPFVVQLVEAVRDLGGLEDLGWRRLGDLIAASTGFPDDLGSFRSELACAWEITRPPGIEDLADTDVEHIGPDVGLLWEVQR